MSEKIGLYQKILKVMEAIDYLQKDDQIEYKSTKYKAISEEKVTKAVREQLIENKLIVLPIEQEHKKDGTLTTVDTKYKIIDVETGEYEILVSAGTGADTQDKGVGKAMTYAYKYLFLRSFAIPTGEDPDKISSAELDEKQQAEEAEKAEKEDLERETRLNTALTKWQVLSAEKDKEKAKDSFNNFLKEKGKDIETISANELQGINNLLAKRLMEKSKESKDKKVTA